MSWNTFSSWKFWNFLFKVPEEARTSSCQNKKVPEIGVAVGAEAKNLQGLQLLSNLVNLRSRKIRRSSKSKSSCHHLLDTKLSSLLKSKPGLQMRPQKFAFIKMLSCFDVWNSPLKLKPKLCHVIKNFKSRNRTMQSVPSFWSELIFAISFRNNGESKPYSCFKRKPNCLTNDLMIYWVMSLSSF